MNGKFGGSSCRSGTLRVRTALTYWLYVVSCECELPEFENQSGVLEAEASRGGSRLQIVQLQLSRRRHPVAGRNLFRSLVTRTAMYDVSPPVRFCSVVF